MQHERSKIAETEDLLRRLREFQGRYEALELDNWNIENDRRRIEEELVRVTELKTHLIADAHKLAVKHETLRKRRPAWLQREHETKPKLVFVLMPYGAKWSKGVFESISDAAALHGLETGTARDMDGRFIMEDIWKGISSAGLVVADISGNNPNVAYELGIADQLGKQVVLLAQSTEPSDITFDFRNNRVLVYDPDKLSELTKTLGECIGKDRGGDS
jgi:hypothetical protein